MNLLVLPFWPFSKLGHFLILLILDESKTNTFEGVGNSELFDESSTSIVLVSSMDIEGTEDTELPSSWYELDWDFGEIENSG
jgi:hypothetical protein